ncbi:hypothetical protein JTB14_016559 [Gonioctena quinquepunctata]|nr:hypothetical protein JTB14_016559 [Gonioctena quinquepunctata]
MSEQIISKIIPNVCDAIVSVLRDNIKMPQSETEWKTIAKEFNDGWNFPKCIGAFDGKDISFQAPIHSGT